MNYLTRIVSLSAILFACSVSLAQTPTNLGPIRTTFQDDVGRTAPPNPPTNTCRRYYDSSTGLETWLNSAGGSCGGGGSLQCPLGSVALSYFNGALTVCDPNANFDGNVTWTFENINSPGTITGGTLASSGPGGILDLQLQTPPTSVPVGHAYVYANSISGLLDCLKNGLVECFSFLQVIASGTAALSTSSVSSGGCNTTTVTATGITTSSKIVATPTVDPTGVTGYGPSASGSLYVQAWPSANNINFKVCNNTSSPITPGALTLDYAGF